MISYKEAEAKILKKHKLSKISSAKEFDSFFLFALVPFYMKEGESVNSGTIFPAIDKKTGKEFRYNILSNPAAFQNAKKIR